MSRWYYAESGQAKGPVESDQLVQWILSGKLTLFDLVFRQGDMEWKPVAEFEDLKEAIARAKGTGSGEAARESLTKENTPKDVEREWVVLKKKEGRTGNTALDFEQMGPFAHEEVEAALYSGKINFADFVWRPGFTNWIRLGNVKEFDRRTDEDRAPNVPTPQRGDEKDLALSTEEEWELTRKIVTVNRNADGGGEKPAEATGQDLTTDPFGLELDFPDSSEPADRAIPQYQENPFEGARSHRAERTSATPQKASTEKPKKEETASRQSPRNEDSKVASAPSQSRSRFVEIIMILVVVLIFAGIGGGIALYFLNRSGHLPTFLEGEEGGAVQRMIQWIDQKINSHPDETQNESEDGDEETGALNSKPSQGWSIQSNARQARSPKTPKKLPPPSQVRRSAAAQVESAAFRGPPEQQSAPSRTLASRPASYLKVRVMSSQAEKLAKLILETDGAGQKAEIRVHAAPGKVMGVPGFNRVFRMPIPAGKTPVEWYFGKNGLPPGVFQMEVQLGEHKKRFQTGYINRGADFRKNMQEHLKHASLTIQNERKALFYSVLKLEGLAKEFASYLQAPGPEAWSRFQKGWNSRIRAVLPPGLTRFQAYGLEASQLKELHFRLQGLFSASKAEFQKETPEKISMDSTIVSEIRALKLALARQSAF